jgi:tripartite-type tricarboxylate transporter receptor subunit TctC
MKPRARFLLSLSLAASASAVISQTYPDRPVELIVPLTAGSGIDIAARVVAKYLSDTWKQPVIVSNRPGAGGLIGTEAVVKAKPDGYTLLVQSASHAANPAIYKSLPYDPVRDLIDVNTLGQVPYVMVTSSDGPYKSVKALVAAAKARPGEITFASAGTGTSTHLVAELFSEMAATKMRHIPYKGGPPAFQDVIGGQVDFFIAAMDAAMAQIKKGGRLRALGLTSATRSDAAPEIPTLAEEGFPKLDINLWYGVWAPAGTPDAIVHKINADINRAVQSPEIKAIYAKYGVSATPMTPEAFSKFVRNQMALFKQIAQQARIEPQ